MKGLSIITADGWNALLETDRGQRVCDVLRPYQEMPISLKPPVEGLEEGLTAELADIGVTVKGVATIPLGVLEAAAEKMPGRLAAIMRWDMAGAVNRTIPVELGHQIEAKFGSWWPNNVVNAVSASAYRMHHSALEVRHPDIFVSTHRQMPFDLLDVQMAQVRAVIQNHTFTEASLAKIGRRFLQGNFPLGSMRDGSYAVLVA